MDFSMVGRLMLDRSPYLRPAPRGTLLGLCLVACLGFFLLPSATSQNIISTVAGGGSWKFRGDGAPADAAPLGRVRGLAVDSQGNVFAGDSDNHLVVKIAPGSGVLTVVAGTGTAGFSGDGGSARSASLNGPSGLTLDLLGNLFILDQQAELREGALRIRKVNPNGVISTAAGNGFAGFSGDGGLAAEAHLNGANDIAVDSGGNLYIADSGNNRVRRVSPDGVITTVVGNGACCFSGDSGPATDASLNNPSGLAFDREGNLFIADTFNDRIRKVAVNGTITTVAGNGTRGFSGDGGPATQASLNWPADIAFDDAGNLLISDRSNQRVRKVTPGGTITTEAGNGNRDFFGDGGPAVAASLSHPQAVAAYSGGAILIADTENWRVRRVGPDGTISTFAGNGSFGFSGDGGPATNATLRSPQSVSADSRGNLFLSDNGNFRIRRVASDGTISTVAGKGLFGFSGDNGPARDAAIRPGGIALDPVGNLFIADSGNQRLRKVSLDGIIATAAGPEGFSNGGGPAVSVSRVAVDHAGNQYVTDNCRVLKIAPSGTISTVNVGSPINCFGDLAVDEADNLYVVVRGFSISRRDGHVLKVTPAGTVTVAAANLVQPVGVAVDQAGNLYVSEPIFNRVLKISSTGEQLEFAGSQERFGFAGDGGPAENASLYAPLGLGIDAAGNLYIADNGNQRIRKVFVAPPALPLNSVVNGASFRAASEPGGAIAPGAIVSVFGTDLATSIQEAARAPLPNTLLDTRVTFNDIPAPLFFVSGAQINAQVPFEVSPGTALVKVERSGRESVVREVGIAGVSPGIFTVNRQGTGAGAILHASDFQLVTETVPAERGEFLAIFCTGLGLLQRSIPSGEVSSLPPPETASRPTVTIGGIPATVTYSGLAPGFVGLYQVNVQVPESVPSGRQSVQISIEGVPSNTVTLDVR